MTQRGVAGLASRVSILGKDSIIVGYGIADEIADELVSNYKTSCFVIVCDSNVGKAHLPQLEEQLQQAAQRHDYASLRIISKQVPPGEQSKTRETKASIEDWMLQQGCARDTVLIAMGGGVIGDMCGFVAATYMRGIKYVQVPTTLLAMVDSSVGGKTAVDTPHGKNLVGAFWQPERVFIDCRFLETLPRREFLNGMAEVIKTAVIWDAEEFTYLESKADEIMTALNSLDEKGHIRFHEIRDTVEHIIRGSVSVKAEVVTKDEREGGLRNLLNYGHSVGHAYEAMLFPGMLHGECVSFGMVKEAEISRYLGHLPANAVGRLVQCLKMYELPTRLADLRGSEACTVDRILDIMRVDKKNDGPRKKIALLDAIGKTHGSEAVFVTDQVISVVLEPDVRVTPNLAAVPMQTRIKPPGSKSMSNRALILAALGRGPCRLKNMLFSDDTQYMMAALAALGVGFAWEDKGDTLVVQGSGGAFTHPDKPLYVGNAGTASRFLTSLCTLVQPGENVTLTGNSRMQERPIGPLVDALHANGCEIGYLNRQGSLPLSISTTTGLRGGDIELTATISSQYVSSVLMCAPYAAESTTLRLTGGKVISRLYIDMTIRMMQSFGISVEHKGDDVYSIPRGTYANPHEYVVESDASSATYPLAVAAISGTVCTVESIGSTSLQGDALFAQRVLAPMGCKVNVSADSISVEGPPPGTLRALGPIDMEDMTDAFLTACVLAAVAQPAGDHHFTDIHGIANQRVKECDRIAAMVRELGNYGVQASELPDGIRINAGSALSDLKPKDPVNTYDDHRVAMAMSVLALAIQHPSTLKEKVCVEKTWPAWWDELHGTFGVALEGVAVYNTNGPSSAAVIPTDDEIMTPRLSGKNLVIVGMRGAGKTSVGRRAALALRREFVDLDTLLEEELGMSIPDVISQHGWAYFREQEEKLFRQAVSKLPGSRVLASGGGIVESEKVRLLLEKRELSHVIEVLHVRRNIQDTMEYLDADKTRPAYVAEHPSAVWARRRPYFDAVSDLEFFSSIDLGLPGVEAVSVDRSGVTAGERSDEEKAEDSPEQKARHGKSHSTSAPDLSLERFLARAYGQRVPGAANSHERSVSGAYALVVAVADVNRILAALPYASEGCSAIELRADCLVQQAWRNESLSSSSSLSSDADDVAHVLDYLAEQVSLLHAHTTLPVVFSLRTCAAGGTFPETAVHLARHLLRSACRWAVDYVELESTWPQDLMRDVVNGRHNTQIIMAEYTQNTPWQNADAVQVLGDLASNPNRIAAYKVVALRSHGIESNLVTRGFAEQTMDSAGRTVIAFNAGASGRLSQALNRTWTPTLHTALRGLMNEHELQAICGTEQNLPTIQQLQELLLACGQEEGSVYYLFGHPISHSRSPALHNALFRAYGMPQHEYRLFDAADMAACEPLLRDASFGGASVTIPLKVDVIKYMHELTDAARRVGAVNTIVVKHDGPRRILCGDNTDWIGIVNSLEPYLPETPGPGLVIGAGGTSRAAIEAMVHLQVRPIYIVNRTPTAAAELCAVFADADLRLVSTVADAKKAAAEAFSSGWSAAVSAVPAHKPLDEHLHARVDALMACGGHVFLDMAYHPRVTQMMQLASDNGWKATVSGLQVLVLQGLEQFRLWTGIVPSEAIATMAVLSDGA